MYQIGIRVVFFDVVDKKEYSKGKEKIFDLINLDGDWCVCA